MIEHYRTHATLGNLPHAPQCVTLGRRALLSSRGRVCHYVRLCIILNVLNSSYDRTYRWARSVGVST
jgi:hypothetical protein